MKPAFDQFRTNIVRVRNLGSIVDALASQTTGVLDLSDVLRAEIVLAVSALDQFVHEIVRLGMLDCYRGARPPTRRFQEFQVSLGSVLAGFGTNDGEQWIDDEIRMRNGYRSFQTPDNIVSAVGLVADVRLWDEVSELMGVPAAELRNRLSVIVDRRNKISHEADISSSPYEELWPIDREMVVSTVDFIEAIVESMYQVLVAEPQEVA